MSSTTNTLEGSEQVEGILTDEERETFERLTQDDNDVIARAAEVMLQSDREARNS